VLLAPAAARRRPPVCRIQRTSGPVVAAAGQDIPVYGLIAPDEALEARIAPSRGGALKEVGRIA
jgi:hypothetical protein